MKDKYVMKGTCIDCKKFGISVQSLRCRRCQGKRRSHLNAQKRKQKAGL